MFGLLQIGLVQQQVIISRNKNKRRRRPRPHRYYGNRIGVSGYSKRYGYKYIGKKIGYYRPSIRERFLRRHYPTPRTPKPFYKSYKPKTYNFGKLMLDYTTYTTSRKIISDIYTKLKNRSQTNLKTVTSKTPETKLTKPVIHIVGSKVSRIKIKLLINGVETEIHSIFINQILEKFDILRMTPIYIFEFNLPFNIYDLLEKTYDKYIQIEMYDSSNNRLYFNTFYIIDTKINSKSESSYNVNIYQLENKYIQLLNDYNFYLFENKTINEILEFIQNKYGLNLSTTNDIKTIHLTIPKYSNINLIEFLRILTYYSQNKKYGNVFYKQFIRDKTIYFIHDRQELNTILLPNDVFSYFSLREFQEINSLLFINRISYNITSLNQFEDKESNYKFQYIDNSKLYNGSTNYFIFNDYEGVNTLPEIMEMNYQKWIKNHLKKIKSVNLDNVIINDFSIFSKLRFEDSSREFIIIGYDLVTKIDSMGNIQNKITIYFV